ncbi:PQQ-dependent sugar dehydrogenase [Streptomyces xiaopingdaonensis]|uniref:PQQ-dependent sugar dehydrogenase n=1 Tax=Streptomyces xiaopingdaonensis TaxID=1565415 RepID=UPI000307C939|nr:PQQ-dependent sugar dehydrogenase [Streptomyces xiaopingdaonensis]
MPRHHRTGRSLLTLGAAAALVAAGFTAQAQPAAADVPLDSLNATATEAASGLDFPTALTGAGDGSGDLLVTEKKGTVRSYHPDTGLAEQPLLDISDLVTSESSERGLLGVATGPDFAETHEVYVAYTAVEDGAVTLARHGLDDDSHEVLLQHEHLAANHNGGQLAFDSAGLLYWGIGDGGMAGDPDDNAQSTDTLLGKILRIDPSQQCGEQPYCVPEGNPFVDDSEARSEIWTYGLRNPWKFSLDAADDSLWIGDVGQNAWEEVDHLAADQAGANLGWSCYEGTEVYDETRCRDGEEYVDPVFTYATNEDGCAVIGGHVYRGEQYADLADGVYLATDYCSATAFAVRETSEGYESATIGELPESPTALGTSEDGEQYVVTESGGLYAVGFEEAGTEG